MRKIGSNFLLGGQKIKLKFNFPSGEVQKLRALPGFGSADFGDTANWRRFLDIVRNYFAQHPEVTL
jgi:hypothetical protein